MFLRLGWVVGQAGIGLAVLIIWLAAVVVVLTSLSMSAISTNGEVKSGGIFFQKIYRKVPSIRRGSYLSFNLPKQGGLIPGWGPYFVIILAK